MTVFRWSLIWLFLVVVFAFVTGRESVAYYRLSKNGVIAPGQVLEKKSHMLIRYSFKVNGYIYGGIGRGDSVSPSFNELSIGDEILVHYLPSDPNISCLGDPGELYSGEFVSASTVVFLFPTLIIGVLVFRYRKRLVPFGNAHVPEI